MKPIPFTREQLLAWPIPWRECWGRLANLLEERLGVGFPESEAQAFAQIDELRRNLPIEINRELHPSHARQGVLI